jgi:hypothetical protein
MKYYLMLPGCDVNTHISTCVVRYFNANTWCMVWRFLYSLSLYCFVARILVVCVFRPLPPLIN